MFLLAGASAAELLGTPALNVSEGSRALPTLGVLVGDALSFSLPSLVLEEPPVGVVYGIWSVVGIVGVTLVGVVVFDERSTPPARPGWGCW